MTNNGVQALAVAPKLKTRIGVKLLAVLRDFGGYLDDNTASDTGAFNVEMGVEAEVAAAYGGFSMRAHPGTAFYNDMYAIYRELYVVQNNAEGTVGGGGQPRVPLAPPLCP